MDPRADSATTAGSARGRSLLVLAGLLAVAGIVLAIAGLQGSRTDDFGTITAITTSVPPSTGTATPTTTPPSTGVPESTTANDTTNVAAIIASLNPDDRGSALPVPPRERAEPVRVLIDRLKIDVRIIDVGTTPEGELDVPDVDVVGWYRPGSAPGEDGATVLAAHVTWGDQFGPFLELGTLEAGDRVQVTVDGGEVLEYQVTERHQYPKDALPPDRIWATNGPETLVLITCGGEFDNDIRRFDDNVVVYAEPITA